MTTALTTLAIIRYCMGCGRPTVGSIGAAGIYWPRLCQPCKDQADGIALAQLKHTAQAIEFMSESLNRPTQKYEVIG